MNAKGRFTPIFLLLALSIPWSEGALPRIHPATGVLIVAF